MTERIVTIRTERTLTVPSGTTHWNGSIDNPNWFKIVRLGENDRTYRRDKNQGAWVLASGVYEGLRPIEF